LANEARNLLIKFKFHPHGASRARTRTPRGRFATEPAFNAGFAGTARPAAAQTVDYFLWVGVCSQDYAINKPNPATSTRVIIFSVPSDQT
jgi:hypothetical protein